MAFHRWICVFVLFVLCTTPSHSKKPRSVTTLINAKWDVTPLVFEVAEFLADEQSDYMWTFVETINNLESNKLKDGTEKEVYDELLTQAGRFISPAKIQLLKLALSLHIYAPKVAMYKQVADEQGINNVACSTMAIIGNTTTCDPNQVSTIVEALKGQTGFSNSFKMNVDHHYPGSANNSITAVLYGKIGSQIFTAFHKALKKEALNGNVDYILRHYVQEPPGGRIRLSGYGVELQLKSTEYKVQDDSEVKDGHVGTEVEDEEEIEGFNFQKLKELYPDHQEQLNKFRQHLVDSSDELAPLKVWQFQALSLQAAQQIMDSPKDEALHVMATIAQNFPQQARPLLRVKVNPQMKKEIKVNQDMFTSILNLQPQDTAIFINGMFFDLDVVDIISLLEVLREEHRTMQGLHSIGISDKQMKALMALDFSSWLSDNTDYALDIRDTSIVWINNVVTDEKFRRASSSFRELFQPVFSGTFRSIKRNLYNLVIIGDPSKSGVLDLLDGALKLYQSPMRIPIRIGVVFAVTSNSSVSGHTDAGVAALNAFNYLTEKLGPVAALTFLTDIYSRISPQRDLEPQDIISKLKSKYSEVSDKMFDADSEYDTGRVLADDYLQRSGLRNLPQALMNGIPMEDKYLNADEFEGAVLNEMHRQTPIYQKAFFRRELLDSDNEVDFIMNRPNVMPRLNARVLNVESGVQLDLSGAPPSKVTAKNLPEMSSPNISALVVKYINYLIPPERPNKKSLHYITNWVVADLASEDNKGRELLQAAVTHMESSGNVRVGFIPNVPQNSASNLNHLVVAAFKSQPAAVVKAFIKKVVENAQLAEQNLSDEDIIKLNIPDLDVPALRAALDSAEVQSLMALYSEFCRRVVSIPQDRRAVISNGRVIGPLDLDEPFTVEDFGLLERHCTSTHVEKIKEVFVEIPPEDDVEMSSDMVMKVINVLLAKSGFVQARSRFQIPTDTTDYSVLKLEPERDTEPAFFIDVIVDPVSRGAQKASSILLLLRKVLNCYIRVFLNPVDKNSDMPLKSFYRFVAEPELQFLADGSLSPGPIARFTNLPTTSLLTQNLQVPENWLVESVRSPYDLDNIRLESVVGTVHSEYELEHLLLEGHCFEVISSNPPRGLQMTLGTKTTPLMVDTIVMANLGYFQFKANPGAWVLRLRQGRSADLYDIVGHEGTDSMDGQDIRVVISSFRSHVLKLRVQKKPDKKNQDLLADDEDENSGLWSSLTNTFGGGSDSEERQEPINIFSLASGHLYERFLRIMMLSVLRHTKSPVKFWFLKNYLSPTFKDFLPHMAKEYGFQYQLVEYKWPRWLHQQTEKQRTIWGYKILFLDVLFPLDVKKIIFVDADQVVRADLKELRDFDLGGAPYGYTPFCDSRKEMDGFRFWKQGYWRSHLQGRRYHISALYVVDLKKFRRVAAGDRLRGQYQALSQDPNSLSNLDQDLPNNMIHQVQIKSLPQEWLWCETWCDDGSLKYAKTIDLCNNPMTKEAKLSAAMRILPEWKEYDEEIKRLQKRIIQDDLESSAEFIAAAKDKSDNVNVLRDADQVQSDTKRDEL